jgi:hypothetical protein
MRMQLAHRYPDVPVGEVRSFGTVSPRHEIGAPLRQLNDGDWLVKVTMIETGEVAEYRLSQMVDDPTAT